LQREIAKLTPGDEGAVAWFRIRNRIKETRRLIHACASHWPAALTLFRELEMGVRLLVAVGREEERKLGGAWLEV
jgi:hypothetical protein